MDVAYDHIQENSFPKGDEEGERSTKGDQEKQQQPTINEDFQEAYKAFSASPWGSRIGGFLGTVVKQGEQAYGHAQKELTAAGGEATRGFTDLRQSIISRTRALSLTTAQPSTSGETRDAKQGEDKAATTPTDASAGDATTSDSTVLSRFKSEAAKRLHDLQRAEDAADEALLRFGSNVRDFLKGAVTINPPSDGEGGSGAATFESKDAQGKRVIHASRFDAQLHVIHTSVDSFNKDPDAAEFAAWAEGFDVEKRTDEISGDLLKYPELRATMEKLVPGSISYADFWKRYYFLRHSIETAEARRRDLLQAASAHDEVGWGDDSDDEEEKEGPSGRTASAASSTTLHAPARAAAAAAPGATLKPSDARRSSNDEKSQAGSDASYDVVGAASGVPSQAPNSPKDSRKDDEDSDEDWE
ncbi:related to DOS1 protein [Cephalotrichum gorgonifer]|uniref:Related to DOS1 protein n=1 Tax=Cephalotrichum gorgonifer TaxID=2041049 RepID=A0AAE8N4V1_9PEZI|nr:related to DOS1 protein [Cephalotrichum gorgonifer]